jgi:glycine/D-amino acid oxidase-like deaminating enzyme
LVISTTSGDLIGAKHLVFCTAYEFLKSLENRSQSLISTWAIARKPHLPRPKWLDSFLVWEGSEPYLYFRTSPDGRVIVGGEDENTENASHDDAEARKKAERLAEKLGDLTGIKIGSPDFVWSAAFGTTPSGLPMIGAVPGHRNVFAAMGYGGNGITFSQIAASMIASEIAGHRDSDADLFPFQ